MRNKKAKQIRRLAAKVMEGKSEEEKPLKYKQLKAVYKKVKGEK